MQQVFINRRYHDDKNAAYAAGVELPKNRMPTKVELYQLIAAYLGISVDGMELDQLWAAIDAKNQDLACVGVAEPKKLNKPVLRRDRKPVERPKLPMRKGGLEVAIMRPKKIAKPIIK